MPKPLMPKATAVWLIDNTVLTFEQIADYCELHALEVKGVADGEVAQGIQGLDPIANSQLTAAEIKRCEADPAAILEFAKSTVELPDIKLKTGRYTPLSRRQDRPNAIAWLVRNHAELSDAQISKIVGTTKPTIQAVRDRTHWNMVNIKPVDPVTLGLCKQIDLDSAVGKAQEKLQRQKDREEKTAAKARAAQLAEAEAAGMPSTQPPKAVVEPAEEPVAESTVESASELEADGAEADGAEETVAAAEDESGSDTPADAEEPVSGTT